MKYNRVTVFNIHEKEIHEQVLLKAVRPNLITAKSHKLVKRWTTHENYSWCMNWTSDNWKDFNNKNKHYSNSSQFHDGNAEAIIQRFV